MEKNMDTKIPLKIRIYTDRYGNVMASFMINPAVYAKLGKIRVEPVHSMPNFYRLVPDSNGTRPHPRTGYRIILQDLPFLKEKLTGAEVFSGICSPSRDGRSFVFVIGDVENPQMGNRPAAATEMISPPKHKSFTKVRAKPVTVTKLQAILANGDGNTKRGRPKNFKINNRAEAITALTTARKMFNAAINFLRSDLSVVQTVMNDSLIDVVHIQGTKQTI